MYRRTLLSAVSLFAFLPAVNAQSANRFVGRWSGKWDDMWNMSITVTDVSGNVASVVYTHPEGQNSGKAAVNGNTLTYGRITLTLTGARTGTAVGNFNAGTRRANLVKE